MKDRLIFGIGNTIIADDAIGIIIAEHIEKNLNGDRNRFDVKYGPIAGLSILDEINGYKNVILIDSIITEKGEPGEVYKLSDKDFNTTTHLSFSHGIDFFTAIEVGKKFEYDLPSDITVYAIEVKDNRTVKEELSPEVRNNIPNIIKQILEDINEN